MGWITKDQQKRDHDGLRNACGTCGHDGTPADPLTLSDEGTRQHQSHFTDPNSGWFGHRQR